MPQIKKAWPRIRKVDNGEGRTSYSIDLRPHGPRKYFATEAQAKGEAQIQRIRLMNEGAESFQFSSEQRTDARAALHILEGTGLSLLQAARIARDFHGLQTSGRLVRDAVQALLARAKATIIANRIQPKCRPRRTQALTIALNP